MQNKNQDKQQQGQEVLCSQGEAMVVSVLRILEIGDSTILSKSKAHDDLKDFKNEYDQLKKENEKLREALGELLGLYKESCVRELTDDGKDETDAAEIVEAYVVVSKAKEALTNK